MLNITRHGLSRLLRNCSIHSTRRLNDKFTNPPRFQPPLSRPTDRSSTAYPTPIAAYRGFLRVPRVLRDLTPTARTAWHIVRTHHRSRAAAYLSKDMPKEIPRRRLLRSRAPPRIPSHRSGATSALSSLPASCPADDRSAVPFTSAAYPLEIPTCTQDILRDSNPVTFLEGRYPSTHARPGT